MWVPISARAAQEREDETANPDAAADNAPASLRERERQKVVGATAAAEREISRFDGKFAAV